jgi:23S rRNA pseudouridine1911/1915/1917 synthase
MSHISHPLVGDQDYGKHYQTKENTLPESTREVVANFKRQALHAAVLGFEHPRTKEHMRFEAPIPEDFNILLKSFPAQ